MRRVVDQLDVPDISVQRSADKVADRTPERREHEQAQIIRKRILPANNRQGGSEGGADGSHDPSKLGAAPALEIDERHVSARLRPNRG